MRTSVPGGCRACPVDGVMTALARMGTRFPRFGRWTPWLPLVALAGGLCLAGGCHRTSAEQQVRDAVGRAAQAARDRDAGALDDLLSEDLATPGHDLDRARLLGLLRLARLRDERVSVLMGPVEIEPRGARMLARFTVTLGGGGRLIPEHLGVYRVESAWRREDGDWRCYSASWKRRL